MRRPWNIINVPVYSLVTQGEERLNVNICTYVSAVSMKPKLYAIAIDYNSQTYKNLLDTDVAVLQILSHKNIDLVKPLGKKSGFKYDKQRYLEKKDALTEWNGQQVLKDSSAILLLKKQNSLPAGDHELFIFETTRSKTFTDDNILMFQDLIEARIIL